VCVTSLGVGACVSGTCLGFDPRPPRLEEGNKEILNAGSYSTLDDRHAWLRRPLHRGNGVVRAGTGLYPATISAPRVHCRLSSVLPNADPALPILLVLCAVGGEVASLNEGPARGLALTGVGLLAVILISSIRIAEMVKSQFRRRPGGGPLPDAERLRRLWRRFHLIRTGGASARWLCLDTAASCAA
jgi:hypothetical protein